MFGPEKRKGMTREALEGALLATLAEIAYAPVNPCYEVALRAYATAIEELLPFFRGAHACSQCEEAAR